MARLLVYDAYENRVYTYSSLRENDPMPYSTGRTLTVREFRGKSNSPVLWTTIAAMEAWNLTAANTAGASRWDTPSAASGREATAPAANTMPAWPSTWGRASAGPSAPPSTTPPAPPGRGAMSSR